MNKGTVNQQAARAHQAAANGFDSGKYTQEVNDDFNDGAEAGVDGTPTFFINGTKIVGAQPFSSFQQIIDAELNK